MTAMWVTEKPGAIHIAKKLLILQTLRRVLFAPTNTSATALSDALDTVVRPPNIDPLKLRMEQKQQGVPRK